METNHTIHWQRQYPGLTIQQAIKPADYEIALGLFKEYIIFLGQDLTFQGLEEEFKNPALMYGPPTGCLLIARVGNEFAGCVAIRQKSEKACEMKRLYLRPNYRGMGIGKKLCNILLQKATDMGYKFMRLDTLSTLAEAFNLYKQLGFIEIPAYYTNPLANVIYMEKSLELVE